MDITTLTHMIEWLDEERRKDKILILQLEERLARQDQLIAQLAQRVNGLESEQSLLKESAQPSALPTSTHEQLRQEVKRIVEQSETRRLHAEAETDKRIMTVRENLSQSINDLAAQVERMNTSLRAVHDLRERAERFNDLSKQLQQRMDEFERKLNEPERRLTVLEDKSRSDTKRLGQLESDMREVQQKIEVIRARIPLLEELTLRNETNIKALQNSEPERREELQSFIEAQELHRQQHEIKLNAIYRGFEERQRELKAFEERFGQWEATYRDMKRLVDNFERISSNLDRRIGEVAELQRLSEDRFRNEWNTWQEAEQLRWRDIKVAQDDIWRNHDREFETYTRRINELESKLPVLSDSLARLWNLERARAQLYRERYQTLLSEYDMPSSAPQQNGAARSE